MIIFDDHINEICIYHLNYSQWLKCQTNKWINLKLHYKKSLHYSNLTLVLDRFSTIQLKNKWRRRQKRICALYNSLALFFFLCVCMSQQLMLSLPLSSSLIYNLWRFFCDFRTQMWRNFFPFSNNINSPRQTYIQYPKKNFKQKMKKKGQMK